MKNAIVTGANGFVGSYLCKKLSEEGVEFFAVVKDTEENVDNIKTLSGIKIVYCNLEEIQDLEKFIQDRDVDVFFNFAWAGSVGESRTDQEVQLKNALWTANALKVAKKIGCKKFVNAGSIMEKESYYAMISQESKPGLPYIYGIGKLAARGICKPIANSIGIDLCWAVITNAYGVGEISPRFVNTTLRKIIANEPLKFTAGTQNYDFVYVSDVANAFYLIGKYGKANKEYTIGSGNAKPLREFILEMQQALAPDNKPLFGDVPFTGVNMPIEDFDISQIQEDCGFVPEISFAQGTKMTMQWIKTIDKI